MKTPSTLRVLALLGSALFGLTLSLPAATKLLVGHDLWIGYSGVFVAQDKGFFKEAGLDIELKPFSNPGETLPAMAAGRLDIGLTTVQNLVLLNGTSDSSAVAIALIDASNGADAIVAKTSITSLADLKGRKVGVTLGEVNEFLLLKGLEKAGMKESDLDIVNMSADDGGAAFVAGKIDAAVTWEPWVTKAQSAGGHALFTSAEIPDTIMDCIAVPAKSLAAKRATYAAFLAAISRGVELLASRPDECLPIIAKYLESPVDDVKSMLARDKIYDLAANRKLFGASGTNAPAFETLRSVAAFTFSKGLVPRKVDAATLIDASLVRATRP